MRGVTPIAQNRDRLPCRVGWDRRQQGACWVPGSWEPSASLLSPDGSLRHLPGPWCGCVSGRGCWVCFLRLCVSVSCTLRCGPWAGLCVSYAQGARSAEAALGVELAACDEGLLSGAWVSLTSSPPPHPPIPPPHPTPDRGRLLCPLIETSVSQHGCSPSLTQPQAQSGPRPTAGALPSHQRGRRRCWLAQRSRGAPLVPGSPWASPQGAADPPCPASHPAPRPDAGQVQCLKIALEETQVWGLRRGTSLGRSASSVSRRAGGGDTAGEPRPAAPPTRKGRAAPGAPSAQAAERARAPGGAELWGRKPGAQGSGA